MRKTISAPGSDVSRDVVAAYDAGQAADHDPQGYAYAERALGQRMVELRLFHEAPRTAARQLSWLMTRITGQPPRQGSGSAFDAFITLRSRLNAVVHGSVSGPSSEDLWNSCIDSLRGLFDPPSERSGRLVALARQAAPDADMIAAVTKWAHTPVHLKTFLDAVESFTWIAELQPRGLLDPPSGPGLWPARDALIRLHGTHPDAVVELLSRHVSTSTLTAAKAIAHIARAARLCGGSRVGHRRGGAHAAQIASLRSCMDGSGSHA